MTDTVLLLHGLWMRGFALSVLARRLRDAGFSVDVFDYLSVTGGAERATERLRARLDLAAARDDRVHVIGHSLGGLIALEALRGRNARPGERALCLGSPLKGSVAAARLGAWPGGSFLLGRSFERLRDGVAPWSGPHQVGVIAGRLPYGLGMFSHGLAEPHDGTVAVAETELPGISDHHVVSASHTGLVYSEEVAALCARFLRCGAFAAS